MKLKNFVAMLVLLTAIHPLRSMTTDERRDYLDKLLKTLPDAPAFQQWLTASGELPPDFDALPRMNYLPESTQTRIIDWMRENMK